MIAEAQAKVAELADLRGRIAAQLRGTQAQLGTALDDLAPQAPTDAPAAPAVRAAPPARPVEAPAAPAVVAAPEPAAVAPAPELPALPAASGSTERSDVPVDASTPEPVTRPLPAVRSGTLVLDAAAPDDSPPDVPGATHGRRRHRERVLGGRGRRGRGDRPRALRVGRGPAPDAAPAQAPEQRHPPLERRSASPAARPAPQPVLPARVVPVPPVRHRPVVTRGPRHEVARARHDELVAARAAVVLRRRRPGHRPHHPVAVRPGLAPDEADGPQRHVVGPPGPVRAGHAPILPDPARPPGPCTGSGRRAAPDTARGARTGAGRCSGGRAARRSRPPRTGSPGPAPACGPAA